jgi:hypothetical protein
MNSRSIFLACGLALGAGVSAADPLAEIQRCRKIADSLQRIVCYDAITLSAASESTPARGGGPPAAIAASPPAAGPTSRAVVSPTASPGRGADPDFGLPSRPVPAAQDAVETAIAGTFDGWLVGARFTLANGQVWQVTDGSTATYDARRDPKVRITRGMLGSYFMQIDGVAQMPRVKRLQ